MANTAANVVSGKPLATGGILIAPAGTAVPTDVSTAPGAAFKAAGYIGEDGVTEGGERSTEKIKAWGGDAVKVVQTEHSLTYSFSFIETLNADVLKAIYGDANVTTTPATVSTGTVHKVLVTGDTLPHKAYIFEIKDGDARIRICVPDGQITEVGEVTYSDSEVVAYEVTVECFADANGVKATKYLDNGIFSA
ncbi:hypothetical protein [Cryobacterium sp. BB736]|uniref:phage tail tube protein n=1 Tax=Cryobacterium sp. BB736 TaxID=2746963 RepID=UPI00187722CC|nr:hypothetical protein [Cryobacterium sp. BB736]